MMRDPTVREVAILTAFAKWVSKRIDCDNCPYQEDCFEKYDPMETSKSNLEICEEHLLSLFLGGNIPGYDYDEE